LLKTASNRQPTFFRWLRKEALSAWRFDPVGILQNPQKNTVVGRAAEGD
jgi:hypothetical protein